MRSPREERRGGRSALTLAAVGLCLLAVVAPGLGPGPTTAPAAARPPKPTDLTAEVVPPAARAGAAVEVRSEGWAPRVQLQAVLCGDLAVGGSSSCDLAGAVTVAADARGRAVHQLTVAKPPRPCPCVVRVSTFTGEAVATNVPFTVRGHVVGVPPEPDQASSDLRVERVRVTNNSSFRSSWGMGGSATVTVTVANRGDAPVAVPDLEYGFGRDARALGQRYPMAAEVPAGGTRQVSFDVDLPWMGLGDQYAHVQFEGGVGGVRSDSTALHPFALVGVVGGLVLALGVLLLRGLLRERRGRALDRPGARRFLDDDGSYPLPDVVYVEDVGGYLVKPVMLKNSRLTGKVHGRVSVPDLLVLTEGQARVVLPDGTPALAPSGGIGIVHLVKREVDRFL